MQYQELANSYAKQKGWDGAEYYCNWQGKSVYELIDANRVETDIVGYPSYIFIDNGVILPVTPSDRQSIYDYYSDLADVKEESGKE